MKKVDVLARAHSCKRVLTQTIVLAIATLVCFVGLALAHPQTAAAYPFWAQQTAPETPREATGRIVCANCHLASKVTEIEVPQSVLPDTVFSAVVKVPYDLSVQQVSSDGELDSLQVGAVLMLPEGFKIAPEERIPEELLEEIDDLDDYETYTEDDENVIIIGPLPGEEYQEIIFPVLSPDPRTDKNIHFGKYAIHVGGNRGRGQVYPTGENSNNNVYKASTAGTIALITNLVDSDDEVVGYVVTIQPADGEAVAEEIPLGPQLIVSEGQEVAAGDPLTNNPNVGGFGQADTEIVLQSASRIKWLMAFIAATILSQILLILKKKQIEKVQAAEMNL
ncbi:MAG: apocytochrome f [Hormoscilla sp. GM7CHS1pb]|nr:apocytochrome f [Hormoscilla sp. GM7CHS1pb]